MAATSQHKAKETLPSALRRPLRGIAKRDKSKRLPTLTSSDIEAFFTSADCREKIQKIAA